MLGARDRRGSARRQPGLDFRQVPDDGRRGNSPRCSRGGFSTKIHLRTNANGEPPLTFDVTGGEAHEAKGYEALIELFGDARMIWTLVFTRTKCGADKVTQHLDHSGITAVLFGFLLT